MQTQDFSVEELLEALLGLSGVMFQIHKDFKPIYATDDFARFHGFDSAEALIAQGTIWPQIPASMQAKAKERYQTVIDTGRADSMLLKTQRPDGSQSWVKIEDQRLNYRDGYCVMTVLVDIDEEVQLKQKYEAAAAEAERARAELEQLQSLMIEREKQTALNHLLIGVSHQMNTPLGNIRTSASTVEGCVNELNQDLSSGALRQSQLTEALSTIGQATQLITTSVGRTDQLIRKVKQMLAEDADADSMSCPLGALIRDSITLSLAEHGDVNVKAEIDIDDQVRSVANPSVWMQIVSAFCENALDHGFRGTEAGLLSVRIRWHDDGGTLLLSDNGQGIDKSLRNRVFEPFFTTEMGRYSGLGLALVYSLVTKRLEGEVALESPEFGQGTTLAIRLYEPFLQRG